MIKIIPIIKVENQAIYSAKNTDEEFDEFTKAFVKWKDAIELLHFFKQNSNDLLCGYYSAKSIDAAIHKTRLDAFELERQLFSIRNNNDILLDHIFSPLNDNEFRDVDLQKCKAYRTLSKSWIRLYAIKVQKNIYLITGSAIKLTKSMDERSHTENELRKLDNMREFLRSKGIFDNEGLTKLSDR